MNEKQVILIGYSGHARVVQDILQLMGRTVMGYCELEEKKDNPGNLQYLGQETDKAVLDIMKSTALSRLHPMVCMPVSTTRRHARHIS